MRAASLFLDNCTIISASLFVFMRMGHASYESDLWLIYITLIVSSSLSYGPIGSLFFTTLWTSLFVFASLAFYSGDSYFRAQLPMRLVFFLLTGFVGISLSAELRKGRQNLEQKTRETLQMLAQIVTETRIKLRVLRAEKQPQVAETIAEAEQKVRAILNEHQQKKFDQIATKAREKWEEK